MMRWNKIIPCGMFLCALVPVILGSVTGCSSDTEKTYPVSGVVVWSDGQPATELKGATVELQLKDAAARKVSPTGEVQSDGSFTLRSYKTDDGAPAGEYRALVMPQMPQVSRRPEDVTIMDRRFENFLTSQLEVTIEPKENRITLTVERAK